MFQATGELTRIPHDTSWGFQIVSKLFQKKLFAEFGCAGKSLLREDNRWGNPVRGAHEKLPLISPYFACVGVGHVVGTRLVVHSFCLCAE